jgi:hypothetical protein
VQVTDPHPQDGTHGCSELCQFKNGTGNATSSPAATQQNVRPSGVRWA